jgi:ABC-type Fe3+ transport system substrate-binding protein
VRYALERFLYRLGQTPWRNRLILKGGMLLVVYDVRRATQDLDMAARALNNEEQEVANWLRDVFTVEVDDGVVFDSSSVRVEVIRQGDPYPQVLTSYGQLRQRAWSDFVARAGLVGTVPEQLEGVVRDVAAFADPILSGEVTNAAWKPTSGSWEVG